MSHVFHQLYYHFVWGTHDRQPLLNREVRPEVLRILAEEVATRGGILVRMNAIEDHVHLLVRLTPTILVSTFIGEVKGAASYRIKHEIKPTMPIKWQEGYGVLTVREGDVEKLCRYIDRQEELHRLRKLSKVLEIMESD